MKKELNRIFRRVRRTVARYIVGFDDCPIDNRKNYRQVFDNALAVVGMGVMGFIFSLLAVMCC